MNHLPPVPGRLILSRRVGERIMIGDNVEIVVTSIDHGKVRVEIVVTSIDHGKVRVAIEAPLLKREPATEPRHPSDVSGNYPEV